MPATYDKYYQAENYFGEPHQVLIEYFTHRANRGEILDLGCGQGRNAIPLARLGFEVIGVDISQVGINQMNQLAKKTSLSLIGICGDIFTFDDFRSIDFVLFDSMFHFLKADRAKEIGLILRVADKISAGGELVFCLPINGKKAETLKNTFANLDAFKLRMEQPFDYVFTDSKSAHQSTTAYKMIIFEKIRI